MFHISSKAGDRTEAQSYSTRSGGMISAFRHNHVIVFEIAAGELLLLSGPSSGSLRRSRHSPRRSALREKRIQFHESSSGRRLLRCDLARAGSRARFSGHSPRGSRCGSSSMGAVWSERGRQVTGTLAGKSGVLLINLFSIIGEQFLDSTHFLENSSEF
jgi:hypothetical protein